MIGASGDGGYHGGLMANASELRARACDRGHQFLWHCEFIKDLVRPGFANQIVTCLERVTGVRRHLVSGQPPIDEIDLVNEPRT